MKNLLNHFGKLAGWLKTVLILVLLLAFILLGFVIYKIVKNIMNGAKGVTDILGITKSDSEQKAEDNQSKVYWTADLYNKNAIDCTLTDKQLQEAADGIYYSWGFFHKDFEETMNCFKKCHNKVDLSALVKKFSQLHDADLLSYISPLKRTFSFRNYPTDQQFDMINNFCEHLPNN